MPIIGPGPRALEILAYMEEHGDSMSVDVADMLGANRNTIATLMRTMSKTPELRATRGQLIHVHRWDLRAKCDDARPYPRPVYRLGPGVNALLKDFQYRLKRKHAPKKPKLHIGGVVRRSPPSIFAVGQQALRTHATQRKAELRELFGPSASQ